MLGARRGRRAFAWWIELHLDRGPTHDLWRGLNSISKNNTILVNMKRQARLQTHKPLDNDVRLGEKVKKKSAAHFFLWWKFLDSPRVKRRVEWSNQKTIKLRFLLFFYVRSRGISLIACCLNTKRTQLALSSLELEVDCFAIARQSRSLKGSCTISKCSLFLSASIKVGCTFPLFQKRRYSAVDCRRFLFVRLIGNKIDIVTCDKTLIGLVKYNTRLFHFETFW